MDDRYLVFVRNFVDSCSVEYDYPSERLGVADKFILGHIARNAAEWFCKDRLIIHHNLIAAVKWDMQRYGYSPRTDDELD